MPDARPTVPPASRLERRDPRSGAWVVVDSEPGRVRVSIGTTGNRVDPARRVLRGRWEVRRIAGDLELLATWPVSELVTHRIGEHVDQLADDLVRSGGDPDEDLEVITQILSPLVGDDGARPLDAALWSAAYPLLRTPIERGARPDHMPVALDGVLRAPDARQAARRAFGRVTRPLVRALAASLLPDADGRIPFEPALLALMASPWCGPEALARIVGTGPHRAGAVGFDIGDVDRARAMFHGEAPRRIADRLVGALTEPDGLAELARDLAGWVPPAPERPALAAPPVRPQPVVPAPAPAPPARLAPVRTDVALVHPPRLRAIDGLVVGPHRVVLPRTADELIEWGVALDNCLGGFRHAVAAGRTHLIGVTEGIALRYALEVTRSGVVRQFEAARNRQAPASITVPVLAALREHGVVNADGRQGRSLVAPR